MAQTEQQTTVASIPPQIWNRNRAQLPPVLG